MKSESTDESLAGDGAAGEERQLSLMGGVVGPEGLPEASELDLETGKPKRTLSHGTLVLLAVLVVAAGALYLMRVSQSDMTSTASKDVDAKIEQALAKLSQPNALAPNDPLARNNLNALFKDTNSIVAMFASDPSQRQVPIEFVKKNPFAMLVAKPEPTKENPNPAPLRDDSRHKKLLAEAKDFKLQTVMKGKAGYIAVINGQFLQVGQTFGSFKVKSIEGMSVQLEADGEVFPFQMDDKPGEGNTVRGQK